MVLDPLGIDARRIDADADRQQEILDDAMLAAGVLGHRPALGGEEDRRARDRPVDALGGGAPRLQQSTPEGRTLALIALTL